MANYEVTPEVNGIIKEYSKRIGVEPEEGLNRLIKTADSRKKSLIKYAAENPRVPAAKKAPKAKKEKAAPKGTSLAKKKAGKAKKAPKAKHVRAIDVVSGDTSL